MIIFSVLKLIKEETMKKNNKFVIVEDFRNNFALAKETYKSNMQFIWQNPIELNEIKNILCPDYAFWIRLYNDKKKIEKEIKHQFNKLPKFSYDQLVFFYSLYIGCSIHDTDESLTKKYSKEDYLVSFNNFIKKFPKYKIIDYNNEDLSAFYILPQISIINKNLIDYENFSFMCNLYANGGLVENQNQKRKYVLYQKEFKIFEKKQYIKEIEIVNKKNYKDFEIQDMFDLYLTIVKDKYDWDFQFIKNNYVICVLSAYDILYDIFLKLEKVRPKDLLITSKIKEEDVVYDLMDNLKRIKYIDLKSELNELFGELPGFNEFYVDSLIGVLGTAKYNSSKLAYPFFKIKEYIYMNFECFPSLSDIFFEDYLFSWLWENSDEKERKRYSDIFENMVYHIFIDEAYNFSAQKNSKYEIDNKTYEIDILAKKENTIIICEIKSTDPNNSFSLIEKNIRNCIKGKARKQLHRMKTDFENPEVLKQLNISKEEYENKEFVYMIISTTFDGIGQTDDIVSANLFLLDLILSENNNSNITIKEAYKKILRNIKYAAFNGLEYNNYYTMD
jgi:hypothetical protein